MTVTKNIVKLIRQFRREKNLTQSEVANKVGVSHRYLQTIESGKVDLKISVLNSISEAVETPLCYLFNNECSTTSLRKIGLNCSSEILDLLPIGICATTLDGEICFMNHFKKNRLGITLDRQKPIYIWDVVLEHEDIFKEKIFHKKTLIEKPKPIPLFSKSILADGSTVPTKVDWGYIHKNNKHTDEILGIIFIITHHPSW